MYLFKNYINASINCSKSEKLTLRTPGYKIECFQTHLKKYIFSRIHLICRYLSSFSQSTHAKTVKVKILRQLDNFGTKLSSDDFVIYIFDQTMWFSLEEHSALRFEMNANLITAFTQSIICLQPFKINFFSFYL